MPPRDLRAYLFDIAEACRLIEDFTRGASFADYRRNGVGPGNRRGVALATNLRELGYGQ